MNYNQSMSTQVARLQSLQLSDPQSFGNIQTVMQKTPKDLAYLQDRYQKVVLQTDLASTD